jgi:hypothetical protein
MNVIPFAKRRSITSWPAERLSASQAGLLNGVTESFACLPVFDQNVGTVKPEVDKDLRNRLYCRKHVSSEPGMYERHHAALVDTVVCEC